MIEETLIRTIGVDNYNALILNSRIKATISGVYDIVDKMSTLTKNVIGTSMSKEQKVMVLEMICSSIKNGTLKHNDIIEYLKSLKSEG